MVVSDTPAEAPHLKDQGRSVEHTKQVQLHTVVIFRVEEGPDLQMYRAHRFFRFQLPPTLYCCSRHCLACRPGLADPW